MMVGRATTVTSAAAMAAANTSTRQANVPTRTAAAIGVTGRLASVVANTAAATSPGKVIMRTATTGPAITRAAEASGKSVARVMMEGRRAATSTAAVAGIGRIRTTKTTRTPPAVEENVMGMEVESTKTAAVASDYVMRRKHTTISTAGGQKARVGRVWGQRIENVGGVTNAAGAAVVAAAMAAVIARGRRDIIGGGRGERKAGSAESMAVTGIRNETARCCG